MTVMRLSIAALLFTILFSSLFSLSLSLSLSRSTTQQSPLQSQPQTPELEENLDLNDLVFTTLLEITHGIKETSHLNANGHLQANVNADANSDASVPSSPSSNTFLNLLNKMKQNLVEQQQDEIDQFTKEQSLCDEKAKVLRQRIKSENDTLVESSRLIAKKKERLAVLTPKIAKIVNLLKPKAQDLEVIVKTIEQGSRRRYQQLTSNSKKMNETSEMIAVIDQLSTQLAAALGGAASVNSSNADATSMKFREQIKELGNRITDPALQSLLASALTLADTPSSTASEKNAAIDNLNKLQKLLVLLNKEMHDYLTELKQSEDLSAAAWNKVLSTFAAERALIQNDVQSLLSEKKVAMDEVEKLNKEIKQLNEKVAPLPQKLAVLAPQLKTWTEQCALKKQFFNQQSNNRQDQLATIAAVNKISSTLQGTSLQQALDQVAASVQKSRTK